MHEADRVRHLRDDNFKIADVTLTGFTAAGRNKTKSCGTFSTNAMFMGSCEVFGATMAINGQQHAEMPTKQSAAHAAPRADASRSRGLA
jgi:hypothetical protein